MPAELYCPPGSAMRESGRLSWASSDWVAEQKLGCETLAFSHDRMPTLTHHARPLLHYKNMPLNFELSLQNIWPRHYHTMANISCKSKHLFDKNASPYYQSTHFCLARIGQTINDPRLSQVGWGTYLLFGWLRIFDSSTFHLPSLTQNVNWILMAVAATSLCDP